MTNTSSFAWALKRLKKFNDFVLRDKALKTIFVLGEYDFLQAYQTPIFFEFVNFFEAQSQQGKKNSKLESECGESDGVLSKNIFAIRWRQFWSILFSFGSYIFLVLSRRKILIYTADKNTYSRYVSDFRVANLFRYLLQNRIGFFEILHTVYGPSFFKNFFLRKRATINLEAVDVIYTALVRVGIRKKDNKKLFQWADMQTDAVDDFEGANDLFRRILSKYSIAIDRSKFRISFLNRLLRWTDVKVLIAPVDTRNYSELIAACNMNGIQTYGFQAGNISKYNVGYIYCSNSEGRVIKPQKMLVESSYWKRELIRLNAYFEDGEIEIGGNLKEDYVFENIQLKERATKNITVLIPYEIAAPKEEIVKYVNRFLSEPKVRVVFKMRSDRDLESQALEYGLDKISGNLLLIKDLGEIDGFDVVVGTYSTFLYEMIGRLKPVGVLSTSLDYGEGLLINDIAHSIDLEDQNLFETLERISKTSPEILEKRRRVLYGDSVKLAITLNKILPVVY